MDESPDGFAIGQSQHDERDDHGRRRGQREALEPRQQRRQLLAEDHQVGRVRDRQYKARGIGDQGASQQIGERLGAGFPGDRIDSRRQYHSGSVVGHQHGDDDANCVDQHEQRWTRTARVSNGNAGGDVEQAFAACQLGQQHHAGQKKVHVGACSHRPAHIGPRQKAERPERQGSTDRPHGLGNFPGSQDDTGRAGGGDRPRYVMGLSQWVEHSTPSIC